MFLESRVIEVLSKGEATAEDISDDLGVETKKIVAVLNRLRSAGLLLEVA